MRTVALAVLIVMTVAARAQETVPDTTSPWRYHPMGPSDVWEYEYWVDQWPDPTYLDHYERIQVVGDTTIRDTLFVLLASTAFSLEGVPTGVSHHAVRFDTARALFVQDLGFTPEVGPWSPLSDPFACRLDVGFPTNPSVSIPEICYGWQLTHAEDGQVTGGYEQTVVVGPQTLTATVKRFNSFVGVILWLDYAAGIGLVYGAANELGGYHRVLEYARVGGVTYGAPVVPTEVESPPRSVLGIATSPNPAAGSVTVSLIMPSAGDALIEAFDLLGRRVHRSVHVLSPGGHVLHLDSTAWPAGVYVVRLSAAGVNVSTSATRR